MQSSLGYSIFCPSNNDNNNNNNNNISNSQPKSKYIKNKTKQNKQHNKKPDPYSFTTFVESFNNKESEGHTIKNHGHRHEKLHNKHDNDNDNDNDNDIDHDNDHDKYNDNHHYDQSDTSADEDENISNKESYIQRNTFRNRIEGFTDQNNELQDFILEDVNKNTTVNKMPYPYYIPYYDQLSGANDTSNRLLLNKLDYLIRLLEEQQQYKTEGTTEEIVLYLFLGIFIIYVIDSFARAGKYTR